MFKSNPLFFINFLFFFQHTVFVFEKLCFAENTIKFVFSGKHSFSKTQLVKPTFSAMSKNTFSKKGVIFAFLQFPLKPLLCTVLVQKNILAKTDSVHENARFFSLPDTNSVRQVLLKIFFFDFSHFWMTTLKTIFIGFLVFPFSFFFFFLFPLLQHKKERN